MFKRPKSREQLIDLPPEVRAVQGQILALGQQRDGMIVGFLRGRGYDPNGDGHDYIVDLATFKVTRRPTAPAPTPLRPVEVPPPAEVPPAAPDAAPEAPANSAAQTG